jgi:cell division protein FtsZ
MQRKRFQILKKSCFDLIEDDEAEAVVPVAGNEDLMAMSEFIKNLDVSFELFLSYKDIDFTLLQKLQK